MEEQIGLEERRERAMKRTTVLLAAMLLTLTVMGPAWANQPAFRFTEDVTGDVFECEGDIYTITAGELRVVIHEGESASGNTNFTGTVTPQGVVAEDSDGNEHRIVGAVWFGETFNANTGGFQATFTAKLQIVGQGVGTADNVNLTFHITAQPNNFVLNEFDFGTCELPEE